MMLRNPVSSLTHLSWCVFSVFAAAMLWRLARGDRLRQISVGCFGVSMVLLYLASGVYHALTVDEPILRYFRLIDHSAIYVLIAGTYTPFFALLLRGRWRIVSLALVWGLAAAGIACKWALTAPPYPVTVGLYVAIGWIGLVPIVPLFRAVGARAMSVALLGGLFYTVGAVCDALRWPVLSPGFRSHEVLHLCDILGTLTHIVFIIRFVLPYRPEAITLQLQPVEA
jgi:hemolysin III